MGRYSKWASSGGGGGQGLLDYFEEQNRKKRVGAALREVLKAKDTNPDQVSQIIEQSELEPAEIEFVVGAAQKFDAWKATSRNRQAQTGIIDKLAAFNEMPQYENQGVTDIAGGLRKEGNFGLLQQLAAFQNRPGGEIYKNFYLEPEAAAIANEEKRATLAAKKDELDALKIYDSIVQDLNVAPDQQQIPPGLLQRLGAAGMRAKLPGASSLMRPQQERALGLGDPGYEDALRRAEAIKAQHRPEPMVATETGLMPRSQVQPGTKPWSAPPREPQENPAMEDQRARGLMFKLYGASDLTGLSPDASARAGEAVERMQQYRKQGMTTDQAANRAYQETEGVYKSLKNLPKPGKLKDIQKNRIKQAMSTPGMTTGKLLDSMVSQGWDRDEAIKVIKEIYGK